MTPNDKFPPPEPGVDEVVRAQLDAEAKRVDPTPMADRVLAQLAAELPASPASPKPSQGYRQFGVVVALAGLAAAFLIGMFFIEGPREAAATPAQILATARGAHSQDGDRCYTQTVQLPANSPAPLAFVSDRGRTSTLSMRNDRFVVQPGFGGRGAWGRDSNGRVWIAPTGEAAARFNEDELPPAVREMVKIRALEVVSLLDEVLADFDVTWTEPPNPASLAWLVTATRRGETGLLQLRAAELTVEKRTSQVQSLVLHRRLIHGDATVTFSLIGVLPCDPSFYTAEGHVNAGKPVYDSTKPLLRRRLLLKDLGEVLFKE